MRAVSVWRGEFIERLKATGNVTLAAPGAGVSRQQAYRTRNRNKAPAACSTRPVVSQDGRGAPRHRADAPPRAILPEGGRHGARSGIEHGRRRGAHAAAWPRPARRRRALPAGPGRARPRLAAHPRRGRRSLSQPPAALPRRARLRRLRQQRRRGEAARARVFRRRVSRAAACPALVPSHRAQRPRAGAHRRRERPPLGRALRAEVHHPTRRQHGARDDRAARQPRPRTLLQPARRGGAERPRGGAVPRAPPRADRAARRGSAGGQLHRRRHLRATGLAQALVADRALQPGRPGGHDRARAARPRGDRRSGRRRGRRHHRRHGAVRLPRPDVGAFPPHVRTRRALRRLARRGNRAPGLSPLRRGGRRSPRRLRRRTPRPVPGPARQGRVLGLRDDRRRRRALGATGLRREERNGFGLRACASRS